MYRSHNGIVISKIHFFSGFARQTGEENLKLRETILKSQKYPWKIPFCDFRKKLMGCQP